MSTSLRNSVELDQTVNYLVNSCVNQSTRNVYSTGYKCFINFCSIYIRGFNSSNVMSTVNEDLLLYFVAHCQSALKLKCSTIKLYLAGIRFHGINYYGINPLCDKYGNNLMRLENMLIGIKKCEAKPLKQKLPITRDILYQIYNRLSDGLLGFHSDLTCKTACT